MTWQEEIYAKLKQRDQYQSNNFKQLIKHHNLVLQREKDARDKLYSIEKEALILRQENADLKKDNKDGSSGELSRKVVVELESRLQRTQEELTLSYKRNAENAQLMLDLNKSVKEFEDTVAKKDEEIALLKNKLTEANETIKQQETSAAEKAATFQILSDELKSLRDCIHGYEEKSKRLEQENASLVDRWLKKMDEEATKMNTANDFYEQMVQQTQRAKEAMVRASASPPPPHPQQQPEHNLLPTSKFFDSSFLDRAVVLPTKARRKISGHTAEVTSVAFDVNGWTMATGSTDKTVRLWDALTGVQRNQLPGAVQSIMCVKFSPNNECVLGASNDNSTRIWSVETARLRHTLTGHTGKVFTGSFTHDSSKVVTGSHDRTLKLWDLNRGYCTRTLFCVSSCNDLTISTDSLIVSGHVDHHLRVWDLKSNDCLQDIDGIHENQITSVCTTPDGTCLLTNGKDNTLKIVDIRTFEVRSTFKHEEYRNGLNWNRACISPDGVYVAAGSVDGMVCIWNTLTNKLEKTLSGAHSSPIACCAWSPTGGQLATAGDKDKLVVLWD